MNEATDMEKEMCIAEVISPNAACMGINDLDHVLHGQIETTKILPLIYLFFCRNKNMR